MRRRSIEFRDALFRKAIAVFCFWRRHAYINHSFDYHCIREFVIHERGGDYPGPL